MQPFYVRPVRGQWCRLAIYLGTGRMLLENPKGDVLWCGRLPPIPGMIPGAPH